MTQYLLQIHIGPMQEFIAAARRTRDLWFGSWLMSELSKAVARKVTEIAGEGSLIFPAASLAELAPGTKLSVANKIVAQVENPKAVAEEAEGAMRARLDELAKIALDEARGRLETRETAEKQIRDLPEFYWVAVPIKEGEDGYKEARKQADNLLAARKSCRNFTQPDWGSHRPKSSLDGNRESVIPEAAYPASRDSQEVRESKIKALYSKYHARNAERLSGVDLLKRLGKQQRDRQPERFPSTSHMAAMPLRQRLQVEDANLAQLWESYVKLLPDELKREEKAPGKPHPVFGDADGSLLFETRLRDYYEQGVPDDIKQALRDFLHKVKASPNPYYAILVGDGDSMGRIINTLEAPATHRQFSETLSQFANQAKEIITRQQGAVVYAGGDDVLALLPLHTAIQCAAEVAKSFRDKVSMVLNGYKATFSAGLAIFHHTEPLEDGLQAARNAEKEAKSIKGKNSLAIVEEKRSGAPRLVKGKWDELDQRLLHIAAFYQRDQLPHGLAYQLRDFYLHLDGSATVVSDSNVRETLKLEASRTIKHERETEDDRKKHTLQEIVRLEAGRIIKRKEGSEEARKYVETKLAAQLGNDYTMEQLVNELIIATTVAQAATQAGKELSIPETEESEHGAMDH